MSPFRLFRRQPKPEPRDTINVVPVAHPASPAGVNTRSTGKLDEWMKLRLEILGLLFAGGLCIYQWKAGYFSTDTSIEAATRRVHERDGDVLVVDAVLSRTRRKTELTDLQCRVTCGTGSVVPCSFPGLNLRPAVDNTTGPGREIHHLYIVGWEPVAAGEKIVSMSPGDHTQFAGIARRVPPNQACFVDVAVVMKKEGSMAWFFGGENTNVRRATLVSLPVDSAR